MHYQQPRPKPLPILVFLALIELGWTQLPGMPRTKVEIAVATKIKELNDGAA
jgi:hypothetical protein